MAAALFLNKPVFKTIVEDVINKSIGAVRYFSKKGSTRSRTRYGMKRNDGQKVYTNETLYNQRKLVFAPGLNVGVGRITNLYALVPGRVVISCEKTNFKDNHIVRKTFPYYPPAYRKYMNVIPEPMHTKFKLVEKF